MGATDKYETRRRRASFRRRLAVLQAAGSTFAEHGYKNTTVEAIATNAGVSKGLVFHFFGSKDNLFRSLLEDSLNEIVRRHEILRTTYPATDGQPTQVISEELRLSLPLDDLQPFKGGRVKKNILLIPRNGKRFETTLTVQLSDVTDVRSLAKRLHEEVHITIIERQQELGLGEAA